jgi:hypothetical protein
MKRVEVTLREQDAALIRRLAGELRRKDVNAERLRSVLRGVLAKSRGTNLAEALYDPAISGPEFDEVFQEIEQFRRSPEMMRVRDIDL